MVKKVFKTLILLIGAVAGLLVILIVMASIWILHSMNPSLIKTPSHKTTLAEGRSSSVVRNLPTHRSVLERPAVPGHHKSPSVVRTREIKEMANFAATLEWAKGLAETYKEVTPCQSLCNPSSFQYDKSDPRKIEAFYQKYGADAFNDPKFVFAVLLLANMEPAVPSRIVGILLDYYKHPSATEASKAVARISIEIPRYVLKVKLGYDRGRKNNGILNQISELSHKCHDEGVNLEEIYNKCLKDFETFEL